MTTQVFSPGSVIILQNMTEPEDALAGLGEATATDVSRSLTGDNRLSFSFVETPERGSLDVTGFVEGFGYSEDQSETDAERPSETTGTGGSAGVRIGNDVWSVSVSLDHLSEETIYDAGTFGNFEALSNTDIDGNPIRYALPYPGGSVDRRDTGVTVLGSYGFPNGLRAFGGARIGSIDLETQRSYFVLSSVDDATSTDPNDNIEGAIPTQGETEGVSKTVSGGLAYSRALGEGFNGGVFGSLTWTEESIDGFTENTDGPDPDGDVQITYGDDVRTSVLSRLGVSVSRPIQSRGGATFVPSVRAAWLHEFDDDSREIDLSTRVDLPGEDPLMDDSEIVTNKPDRDYFTVGFGLSEFSANGRGRLFVEYERVLGHDFIESQSIRIGGQIKF